MTHELWATLSRKMVDYLDSVSLQDLVDQQRMRQLEESVRQQQSSQRPTHRITPEQATC